MPLKETGLVLCNVGASAGSQNRNFLLDFLNIVLAGLEIDLKRGSTKSNERREIETRRSNIMKAYVFNGNNLAVSPVNGFVNHSETTTCKRRIQLADGNAKKNKNKQRLGQLTP